MSEMMEYAGRSSAPFLVTVGDGISATEIVRALRKLYYGGVRLHGCEADQIPYTPAGQIAFHVCERMEFRDGAHLLASDVLRDLHAYPDNSMTYEIGLRWFLASPATHIRTFPARSIYVLPKNGIEQAGKPCALVFYAGTETPKIKLEAIDPGKPFPDGDFLMSHPLYPASASGRGPSPYTR